MYFLLVKIGLLDFLFGQIKTHRIEKDIGHVLVRGSVDRLVHRVLERSNLG